MENNNVNLLFQEKRKILNNFAGQFTTDPDEKEDLIQETMLRALKSIDRFIRHPKLMTWLYVIMKNTYINQYRKDKRKTYIYENYMQLDPISNGDTNRAEQKLMADDIQKAMNTLPKENAEIFRLYLEGYKYHEIAELFFLPEGTVKSRIHLTRKILQKKLIMYQPQ